jgi:hypothetical protein
MGNVNWIRGLGAWDCERQAEPFVLIWALSVRRRVAVVGSVGVAGCWAEAHSYEIISQRAASGTKPACGLIGRSSNH